MRSLFGLILAVAALSGASCGGAPKPGCETLATGTASALPPVARGYPAEVRLYAGFTEALDVTLVGDAGVPGLTLMANRLVGTPTTAGDFAVTPRLASPTDACTPFSDRSFIVTVKPAECETLDWCFIRPLAYGACTATADCGADKACVAGPEGVRKCFGMTPPENCGSGTAQRAVVSVEGMGFDTCGQDLTQFTSCLDHFCR